MSDELKTLPRSLRRGPVSWMAGNSVAANLIMLVCLLGGLFMAGKVRQEVFPDVALDIVQVLVPYPASTPEDVEKGILLSIEDAVESLDGVDDVTSTAREGMGEVRVEMRVGEDIQKLLQDVKNEVDRILTFPEETERPQVVLLSRRRPAMAVALYGDVSEKVLRELAEEFRDRLRSHDDISQVELDGVRELEISVEVSQANQRRYGLSLEEIARRLRGASVDLTGGSIKTLGGEILVRMTERRDFGRQFAQTPIITTADGTEVLLEEIATIRDTFADTDYHATYNGKRAVMLRILRVGDQTPIEVVDAARKIMDDFQFPPGVAVGVVDDKSKIYRQRLGMLLRNGMLGLVLVLCVLGLFLEVRLAFWVMLGIPISFAGSLLILPMMGVSINMVSMFAYIIALGIVVDDAIVVGENIYHHHQEGMPFLKAAIVGAREVAMPVTFSILTNIVMFLPLALVPGTMGKFFINIPAVVVVVFLISLVESLFVLPAHLGHQSDPHRTGLMAWLHAQQQKFSHGVRAFIRRAYSPFLRWTLMHRYVTISISIAVLIMVVGFVKSGRMGMEVFPKIEADLSQCTVTLPYGVNIETNDAIANRLVESARAVVAESGHPELLEGIFADIGKGGNHQLVVNVYLADADVRDTIMGTAEFTNRWRKATGRILGLESIKFASDVGGPGSGAAITVELSHKKIEVLDRASGDLARILSGYRRCRDIDDGYQPGKRQFSFVVKPEGKSLGLDARMISTQLRHSLYGSEVKRQQRGRDELKIMVRRPKSERISEYDLDQMVLRTPAGKEVMLRDVAVVTPGRAYTTIERRQGRRRVNVTADVIPRSQAGEILADIKEKILPELQKTYPGLQYSFEGRQADMRESMSSLLTTFPIALLVIYALLAIPFRSYIQPLVVMVAIPFGIVGAVLGHVLMGYSLSMMSMFGIVALSGVVVNDSLVLLEFANRRVGDGETHFNAVREAGVQRFRAIVLTTLTTFFGLMPMITETSRQAKFLIPMAISLGFGILFATLITLVIVPSLYLAVEDVKRLLGQLKRLLFG